MKKYIIAILVATIVLVGYKVYKMKLEKEAQANHPAKEVAQVVNQPAQPVAVQLTSEELASQFIQKLVVKVAPLSKEMALAYWEATGTGKEEAYNKYSNCELQIRKIYSDREAFAELKKFKEDSTIQDPLIKRQLHLLNFAFMENQMDSQLMEQMVKLSSEVENAFNTHRAEFEGQKVSDNVIVDLLKTENNLERRKVAWEASKTVGEVIAPKLLELVRLRNKIAQSMGFVNYYEMRLLMSEQEPKDIEAVFEDLAKTTEKPFAAMKQLIDNKLRVRYGMSENDVMYPYCYQDRFFQEVQDVGGVEMDAYIKDKDVKSIVENFYNGMGLRVTEMFARSDLYEREGKYQHAYCMDVDREGDVRTMMSMKNNRNWLETTLHELGHGVYSMNFDRSLPWLLREEAHIFTTEAIAMLMESLSTNVNWLEKMVGIPTEVLKEWQPTLELEHKMGLLIFCRWTLVMYNFERQLYTNPDQDLNKLWWDLVEKYQFVNRIPERNKADWASKIHFTSSPVYYHNYMLGNLLVSQLKHYIALNILKEGDISKVTFIDQPEVGKFLREKIFAPGKKNRWDTLLLDATGESLTAKYFGLDVEIK